MYWQYWGWITAYPYRACIMHNVMGQITLWLVPLSSLSAFYIHRVFLFPMKLVAYSSAVWQIRCAVKWSMTESKGKIRSTPILPCNHYLFISVGKYPRTGKKIRPNVSEVVWGKRFFFSPTPASGFVLQTKAMQCLDVVWMCSMCSTGH